MKIICQKEVRKSVQSFVWEKTIGLCYPTTVVESRFYYTWLLGFEWTCFSRNCRSDLCYLATCSSAEYRPFFLLNYFAEILHINIFSCELRGSPKRLNYEFIRTLENIRLHDIPKNTRFSDGSSSKLPSFFQNVLGLLLDETWYFCTNWRNIFWLDSTLKIIQH